MARTAKDKTAERQWLANAMDQAGVGNAKLAVHTGLDANWINQWRNGRRPMPDIAMLKIGRYCGISPYEVRPSLREYADFFQDASILDGLSEGSRKLVLDTIAHFKEMDGAVKAIPYSAPEPNKATTTQRKRK